MLRLRSLSAALAVALVAFAAPATAQAQRQEPESPALPGLGLMGTIPIYWGEADGVTDLVGGTAVAHWARKSLEAEYALRPLDTLAADALAGLDFLLLAQPRPLSPAENVALDAWVRGGGRLLLFADPMLTGRSRFAIGDRRRPQDVILLSPILAHWGLELQFDASRPEGEETAATDGAAIPVNRPGRFLVRSGEGDCTVTAAQVLALCRLGKGQAVVLADAAVLDLDGPRPGAPEALAWLVGTAFAPAGEIAGTPPQHAATHP